MSIDSTTKKRWQEIQSKHDYPVDDKGQPINPKNQRIYSVWREEGIDRFVKQ